jgi:hypothetical protein
MYIAPAPKSIRQAPSERHARPTMPAGASRFLPLLLFPVLDPLRALSNFQICAAIPIFSLSIFVCFS